MIPATLNITIVRGDTCEIFFRVRGKLSNGQPGEYVNLTGSIAKSQIRATSKAPTVSAEFTCSISNQTTVPGGVLLRLTPIQTAAIIESTGMWDVQLDTATDTYTYLSGTVTIKDDVTRG